MDSREQLYYSIDLQRIIEDLTHERSIRKPKTTARHHYDMAVEFQKKQWDKKLKKYFRDLRKWANRFHKRSDDYGNGFKAGIDAAIEALNAVKNGKEYDPDSDMWK